MKLMVYSHDAFGLGNIRRMLAVCKGLLDNLPNVSILLVSGSPMLQGFRIPKGLDYIKLPCLNRGESGELVSKYLGTNLEETIKLRSELILSAARNFKPDLLLVDKKPYGLRGELSKTVNFLNNKFPQTKLVLLLRDILDSPKNTVKEWQDHNYYKIIETLYDQILIVGMPEVFNLCQEYQFPEKVANKVNYCGYISKDYSYELRENIRQELGVEAGEKLVLVTPGGGEDGYKIVHNYLAGVNRRKKEIIETKIHSLIICGPEMPAEQRGIIAQLASTLPHVKVREFTDDLMGYLDAADKVVCMGGYNTLSEALQLNKEVVVVPRTKPGQEQSIRAERFARLSLLQTIHPDKLTPEKLIDAVRVDQAKIEATKALDFLAIFRIVHHISYLVDRFFPQTSTISFNTKNTSLTLVQE
jgi:predicted glycosyltransferase